MLDRHDVSVGKLNTLGRCVDIGGHGSAGVAVNDFDATGGHGAVCKRSLPILPDLFPISELMRSLCVRAQLSFRLDRLQLDSPKRKP